MSEMKGAGVREHKRQETLKRITQESLRLFGKQGYEATTLDAIAAAAGISRRTFFHYFKSKDDILLSLHTGLGEQIIGALQQRELGQKPFPAIREAALRLVSEYPLDELEAIDRLMMASESVQARKLASYAQDEAVLFAFLRAEWPDEAEAELRALAMLSIGTARLALAAWRQESVKRPLSVHIEAAFDAIERLARGAD